VGKDGSRLAGYVSAMSDMQFGMMENAGLENYGTSSRAGKHSY